MLKPERIASISLPTRPGAWHLLSCLQLLTGSWSTPLPTNSGRSSCTTDHVITWYISQYLEEIDTLCSAPFINSNVQLAWGKLVLQRLERFNVAVELHAITPQWKILTVYFQGGWLLSAWAQDLFSWWASLNLFIGTLLTALQIKSCLWTKRYLEVSVWWLAAACLAWMQRINWLYLLDFWPARTSGVNQRGWLSYTFCCRARFSWIWDLSLKDALGQAEEGQTQSLQFVHLIQIFGHCWLVNRCFPAGWRI